MDNKELIRTYFERAFVKHDLDAAAQLVSEDYRLHGPMRADSLHGPGAFKEGHGLFLRAMRDHVAHIDDQIAEGDKVVTRWTASGCQIMLEPRFTHGIATHRKTATPVVASSMLSHAGRRRTLPVSASTAPSPRP